MKNRVKLQNKTTKLIRPHQQIIIVSIYTYSMDNILNYKRQYWSKKHDLVKNKLLLWKWKLLINYSNSNLGIRKTNYEQVQELNYETMWNVDLKFMHTLTTTNDRKLPSFNHLEELLHLNYLRKLKKCKMEIKG